MIDTIIFDVGGVLHKNNNEYIKQDISKTLKVKTSLVEKAWRELIPNLLGKGLIDEKMFWEKFAKLTGCKEKIPQNSLLSREFKKRFSINQRTYHIVKSLKINGYKLGIISDTIPNHASYSSKKGLFEPFDIVTLSYQVGLRKPDSDIFLFALKKLRSKADNTIYIDDNPKYVAAARKLGIRGITYRNSNQLKKQLIKLGIQVGPTVKNEETNIGAHAILVTPRGKVILQQRESVPNILNPGKISMFGGTLKKNEKPKLGLKREIQEELMINIDNFPIKKLSQYRKTKAIDGIDYLIHVFVIKNIFVKNLKLCEGEGFIIGTVEKLLDNKKLTRITRLALEDYLNFN
jgi:putative hydrolase of the HAD superfamily